MSNNQRIMVYTVTVIDVRDGDSVLGFQKTPAIFTTLDKATYAVVNNENDLADDGTYQYAVIEQSWLNEIRPLLDLTNTTKMWYQYNSVLDEFQACSEPKQFNRVNGFGIG
jgi:hypothetical protein